MLRYFNMFICIGTALVAISILGFATHNQFLTEAGQVVNPQASIVYLCAGVLMLINGVVSIKHAPPARHADKPATGAEVRRDSGLPQPPDGGDQLGRTAGQ